MENPKDYIGRHISDLPTPAFVVCLPKVERNAQQMLDMCSQMGINLRPHVKTHKTVQGALLQTGGKKHGIVVSTIQEAFFYSQHGFDDILLGRPVTDHVLQRCSDLRHKISLHFLLNSEEGLSAVLKEADPIKPLSVLLKISTGYERVIFSGCRMFFVPHDTLPSRYLPLNNPAYRLPDRNYNLVVPFEDFRILFLTNLTAGIPWDDTDTIRQYATSLASTSGTLFLGLYVHCGNSYTTEKGGVASVRHESIERLITVRDKLLMVGIKCQHLGIGSTPSCSLGAISSMSLLTEVHPGNYIFYDCQQESYGSCRREDIAVRVMTRVVSHHPTRNQIIIDLGFTGLTKQGLGLSVPGYCAIDGHPNLKLVAMTQEMGKLESVDGSKLDFTLFPVDSVLYAYPYHACATAAMYPYFYIHDYENIVRDVWFPTRGW